MSAILNGDRAWEKSERSSALAENELGAQLADALPSIGQPTLGCSATEYRPRSPEQTVLYKTMANHIETFFAMLEGEGRDLPKFVRQEFDAYLGCGIHAYGFLRLRCSGCHSERVVAFY